MKVTLQKSLVNFIGDPHFGKKFPNVPLHRQGEREDKQHQTFLDLLCEEADVCIMVGDLFDTFLVNNDVLYGVYEALAHAGLQYPDRQFIMMEGNHDISRTSETVTSFTILRKMLTYVKNIKFVQETAEYINTKHGEQILLCPYAAFKTAHEEVSKFAHMKFDLVVGHWDTELICGEHNLAPLELLATMTDTVVTGHVHTAETKEIGSMKFYRTGSMLPYSHSEDPNETLYVTRTIEQIAMETAENPDVYKDKCLRVLLVGTEQPPEGINALQFTVKKISSIDPNEKLEVKMETFDFKALFTESFMENGISQENIDKYWNIYKQESSDE